MSDDTTTSDPTKVFCGRRWDIFDEWPRPAKFAADFNETEKAIYERVVRALVDKDELVISNWLDRPLAEFFASNVFPDEYLTMDEGPFSTDGYIRWGPLATTALFSTIVASKAYSGRKSNGYILDFLVDFNDGAVCIVQLSPS